MAFKLKNKRLKEIVKELKGASKMHLKQSKDIEIDGERYHKNWDGELCLRDQVRNLRLFELGWDVKRFWVYEIRDNLKECVKKIQDWKKQKTH